MHLSYNALEEGLRQLLPPPRDEGAVVLVVARPRSEERLTPPRCRLTPEGGVEGDRWALLENPDPSMQISVMRADVARLFANGQPLSRFGDNLMVELDVSITHLPSGTRLQVGTALCEVTPKPHTGCGKFAARFGQDARDITAAPEFQDWRLRGLYFCVLETGEVGPGDRVRVVARPR